MKEKLWRGIIYVAGLTVLAVGLIFNTKSGMGTSALISVPVSVSELWNLNLGLMVFASYVVYILLELLLLGKRFRAVDLLQIPVSTFFSWLINVLNDLITLQPQTVFGGIGMMVAGLILTGIGAAVSVDMQLVPNAGDGVVRALALRTGKEIGLCKNIMDCISVAISLALGFIFAGRLVGVGIGTVLSMILVGRVIYLFNRLFKKQLLSLAGLKDEFAHPAKNKA